HTLGTAPEWCPGWCKAHSLSGPMHRHLPETPGPPGGTRPGRCGSPPAPPPGDEWRSASPYTCCRRRR
ncbi:Tranposon-transfer assisting protein, partial [Dysosmobacter welbionis]